MDYEDIGESGNPTRMAPPSPIKAEKSDALNRGALNTATAGSMPSTGQSYDVASPFGAATKSSGQNVMVAVRCRPAL